MVSPIFHALWLLCGLGAVVFASLFRASWFNLAGIACGFLVAAVGTTPTRIPEPAWIGILTMAVVILMLARPSWSLPAAAMSGILAGCLATLLRAQSVPSTIAWLLGVAILVPALWISARRKDFAPTSIRDVALLAIAIWSILLAAAPAISAGWQSAAALNVSDKSATQNSMPAWVLLLGIASLAIGGLHTFWMRRR
jgi:hypothetical protein